MKVTPVPFDLDLLKSAPGYVRSEGLHMSQIYGAYYAKVDPKRYAKKDENQDAKLGFIGLGLAAEEAIERALALRLSTNPEKVCTQCQQPIPDRPGEFTEPEYGIIFTPDLLLMNGVDRLGEIKLTWMSSREWPTEECSGFPPSANKYLTQMMLQGHCLNMPHHRLYAIFANGPYDKKRGYIPEPRAWDIEFTAREMKEEWDTMIAFARKAKMI